MSLVIRFAVQKNVNLGLQSAIISDKPIYQQLIF
jgi:hypothetical protein